MESSQNLNILRQVGLKDDDAWMLNDKSLAKFFKWFTETVTDDNLIGQNELIEYEILKSKNKVLEGDELAAKLEEMKHDYPHILDYTDLDVQDREFVLSTLQRDEETQKELCTELEKMMVPINRDINHLERQNADLERQEDDLKVKLLEVATNLQDLQVENQRLNMERWHIMANNSASNNYIFQQPIEHCCSKFELFVTQLNLYFENHFNEQAPTSSESAKECLLEELTKVREMLRESKATLINDSVIPYALQCLIVYLKKLLNEPLPTRDAMNKQTVIMAANRTKREETNQELSNVLQSHIQKLVELEINTICYHHNLEKLSRATYRRINIEQLSDVVLESLAYADLLWILIDNDLKRLTTKIDNPTDINVEYRDIEKRIDCLKQLNQIVVPNMLTKRIRCQLGVYNQVMSSIGILNNDYYKFLNEPIDNLIKYPKTNNKNLNDIARVYKKLLFCGSTNIPILFDQSIIDVVNEIRKRTVPENDVNKKMNSSNKNLLREYHSSMENKMWRQRQLLWVWFLSEPKKVLMAIEEVKREVAKQEVNVFKTSGLKRKV